MAVTTVRQVVFDFYQTWSGLGVVGVAADLENYADEGIGDHGHTGRVWFLSDPSPIIAWRCHSLTRLVPQPTTHYPLSN